MSSRRPVVAVVGAGARADGGPLPRALLAAAEEMGRLVVDAGARLVTGGLGGVMAAASRGARTAPGWREGRVVGILPGEDPSAANPWVDVVIPSGLGQARNALVVATAQVVVAIGGEAGTLSEVALAVKMGRPVVALRSSGGAAAHAAAALPGRVEEVETPTEAIEAVLRYLGAAAERA